jgi:hypothetical protein
VSDRDRQRLSGPEGRWRRNLSQVDWPAARRLALFLGTVGVVAAALGFVLHHYGYW